MSTLDTWNRLATRPGGRWLFSRMVCLKAPYFSSIRPTFVDLRPGRAEVTIKKRRAVFNHIGTVHAIAMCNMAELAGGTMTDVSVPATHRWIPRGMTVRYLLKATTDLRAVAIPESPFPGPGESADCLVRVEVTDTEDALVFDAGIMMYISPRR